MINQADEQLFIIKSGDGYFIELAGLTPHLTSDPVEATRYPEATAMNIIGRLWELGYSAELMEIRIGKFKPDESGKDEEQL